MPDIRRRLDYVEAATPLTFERYTKHLAGASFGTKFEGLAVSRALPEEVAGLYHAGSVGIIMSGWLGAVNYGVIVANDVDAFLNERMTSHDPPGKFSRTPSHDPATRSCWSTKFKSKTRHESSAARRSRAVSGSLRATIPATRWCPACSCARRPCNAGPFCSSRHLADRRRAELPVATRINDVRFKRMVRPGEKIMMEVDLDERLADAFFLKAKVTVDGNVAVRFQFACTAAAST